MALRLRLLLISLTPVVMGWQVGEFTYPIVPRAMLIAFTAHLAREMIKDVQDIKVNQGRRITLPMVLGPERVMQLAGASVLFTAVLSMDAVRFTGTLFAQGLIGLSVMAFLVTAAQLILFKEPKKFKTVITLTMFCTMLALIQV